VCCCLHKLFDAALWSCLDQCLPPVPQRILAFRPLRQVMEVATSIQWLMQRADEWNLPLAVVSMDVEGAFDAMQHDLFAESLTMHGAPPELAMAWLREHLDMKVQVSVAGCETDWLALSVGGRQGGSRTPRAWNHIMMCILNDVDVVLQRQPKALWWAAELEELTILIWADNVYILGGNMEVLQERVTAIVRAADKWRLRWGDASLEVLMSKKFEEECGEGEMRLEGAAGQIFQVVQRMEVLGITVDSRGDTGIAREGRNASAMKVWWSQRPLLLAEAVPLAKRMRRWYDTVGASQLFGCGGWSPNKRSCDALLARELFHLRQISGERRKKDEEWGAWMRRSAKAVHDARATAGLLSLAHVFLSRYHSWLGHVSRAGRQGRWSPVSSVLDWRSLEWWRQVQRDFPRAASRNGFLGGRHSSSRTWQLSVEVAVEEVFGVDWRVLAQDRDEWRCSRRRFVIHFSEKWRLPKVPVQARI